MIQLKDYQDNDMSMFFFFPTKSPHNGHNSNITTLCHLINEQYSAIIKHDWFLCSHFNLNFFFPALPSSRVSTVLSVSDLCAPPLEPLALQPKDKGNLSEWFRSLWSVESKETSSLLKQTLCRHSSVVNSH